MLETWGKTKGEMYVQRRKGKKKRKEAGNADGEHSHTNQLLLLLLTQLLQRRPELSMQWKTIPRIAMP